MTGLLDFALLFLLVYTGISLIETILSENQTDYVPFKKIALGIAISWFLCWLSLIGVFYSYTVTVCAALIAMAAQMLFGIRFYFGCGIACLYFAAEFLMEAIILSLANWGNGRGFLINPFSGNMVMEYKLWILILRFAMLLIVMFYKKGMENLAGRRSYFTHFYWISIGGFIGFLCLCNLTDSSVPMQYMLVGWAAWFIILFLRTMISLRFVQFQKEKELKLIIEAQKEQIENNYRNLNRTYRENAAFYHDFRNHLAVMYQMAVKHNLEDLLVYMRELGEPLRELSESSWTGDAAADFIISSKLTDARNNNIRTEINVEYPKQTSIRSHDLSTILGNLLDNAIEACQRISPAKECFVELTIRRIHNMLIIKVRNSSQLYPESNHLETMKEDKNLHGWGMKNIEGAAHKYGGVVQTVNSKGVFQTVVTLYFEGLK